MSEHMKRSEELYAANAATPTPPADPGGAVPPSVQHVGDSVTTGTMPVTDFEPEPPRTRPVKPRRWLGVLASAWLTLGIAAGALWYALVPLPTYQVTPEGFAATSERGLAHYVVGDAWFVVIGVVLGVVCGLVSWRWFGGLGWPVVPLTVAGSMAMGLLCWLTGWLFGPGPLEQRLASAQPGEVLAIELTVRGPVALLVWPFAACLVLMLLSALTRDPEDQR